MRKFTQNKLWREKLIKRMEKTGSIIHTKILSGEEYDVELRSKLVEEAREVQASRNREELVQEIADVYEVIDSLLKHHRLTKEEVLAAQAAKKDDRGGFEKHTYVTTAEHERDSSGEQYCLNDPCKYPEIQ